MQLRQSLLNLSRELVNIGLNKGSSGNCSVRSSQNSFLITPSAIPPQEMELTDLVEMNMEGELLSGRKPSSEWRFHKDIYLARPEINAIIHTHSMFATSIACMQLEIPAFHYMIAMAGGDTIRCAPYALFGTQELSDYSVKALEGRKACLLANHGLIVVGEGLKQALSLVIEVENLAEQYWRIIQTPHVHILSSAEMALVLDKFKTYKSYEKDE
ncbi:MULTISPECIES: class II aldolase/adducin family protein [Legionella]|uniref:L-fuculose phosphate aldolase n=1 Tax=Legionella maceachernii TaxID=466 RepID=A0A0W0W6G7_9GAMM|nr:class II aldolase/adducin family protein [Legionella maceachernii]KTD27967.1 L-fuculose phosphate aldolase [Legionella maceachernii]SKA26116.1 L-fuculose 1-phosphate aldolase [Legionella maceachernii]SUO99947.1 L-fuculose phosphate aldolase [Legionella maceachernii]